MDIIIGALDFIAGGIIFVVGASCILQSRKLTKKDTSGRFESLLT